jgi:lipopolysaccharide/colanic/teichoic acid biosynthesis glycosyltransferase
MLSSADVGSPSSGSPNAVMFELDPWPEPDRRSLARAVVRANRDNLRRHVSVVIAAVAVVLLLPLMLVIAAGIRLSSSGPILTRRTRVGLDRRSPYQDAVHWRRQVDYGGRLFTLYRFRTTPASGTHLVARAGGKSPPTFPLGRILRKYRLDRLPELFNVLKGDMNVVGPRPEHPATFARLRRRIDHYPYRQRVLPGMIGPGRTDGNGGADVEAAKRRVSQDLRYIDRRSVLEDLRILLLAPLKARRHAAGS